MIVADTSALMAVLLGEDDRDAILTFIKSSRNIVIGAPTKFELLSVAMGRIPDVGLSAARDLLSSQTIATIGWTDANADLAASAYARFGKGNHPAALNFGDCMAYALAKSLDAPLLYKGDDFAKIDIRSAL